MAQRGTGFPRLSLMSAVQVVDTAVKFGKSWPKEQFAGFASKGTSSSARSGAFASRIASLRDYGLIVSDSKTVSVTELGLTIAKPVTLEERELGIKQAFLSVETFSELYNSFDGNAPLSVDQVAQHAVYQLGISRDSMDKFTSSFVDSGSFAKLVSFNKDDKSLVLHKGTSATVALPDDTEESTGEPTLTKTNSLKSTSAIDQVDLATEYQIFSLKNGVKVAFPAHMALSVATGYFADPIKKLDELAGGLSDEVDT